MQQPNQCCCLREDLVIKVALCHQWKYSMPGMGKHYLAV